MKTNLRKQLKAYSALAGSTALVVGSAEAQIVHTNFNPDTSFTTTLDLDLNGDGTNDFNFRFGRNFTSLSTTSSSLPIIIRGGWDTVFVAGNNNNANIVQSSSYPAAISSGQMINQGASWGTGTGEQKLAYFYYFYVNNLGAITTSSTSSGNFASSTGNSLGLRISVNGHVYYGWARLNSPQTLDSLYIDDIAFQSFPGVPIEAADQGNVVCGAPSTVTVNDIGNNGNGTDLEVSFNKAAVEAGIAEYRIYVVKSSSAGTFNIDSAKLTVAGNYTVHVPNGSNYQSALAASAKDVDGNLIVNSLPYKVFVVSVPDGQNTTSPAIAAPSADISLSPTTGLSELSSNGIKFRQFDQSIGVEVDEKYIGAVLKLVDVSGREVARKEIDETHLELGTTQFASGVYVLNILHGQTMMNHKFYIH